MQFKKTTLKNGLTIITAPMKDNPSVTVLVMVKAGSKYETKEINGLSHFLEHMCFKGTTKRPKAIDISRELDGLGAQNNAFTGQEYTGYYAKAHPKHFSKILDVVSDMYLNPIFDEKEIEKEKGVIVEEINMYEDMPNRIVQDIFLETIYGDQPAGWNIAGTKESVKKMTRKDFLEYRKNNYVAAGTIVLVAGDINEKKAIDEIENVFKKIPTGKKSDKKKVIEKQMKPVVKIKHKETDQTHIVLGVRTYGAKTPKNHPLFVLNAVLGQGMSSRLFQKLRDEMGVGYYVHSGIDEFTDHGFLAVSTGVDNSRVKEVVRAILIEMKKLVTEKVSDAELQKAKDYMIGHMYLGLESSDAVAWDYASQFILTGKMLTPPEFAEKIQKVTVAEIQKIAKEIFKDSGLNMAIVGNIKNQENHFDSPFVLDDFYSKKSGFDNFTLHCHRFGRRAGGAMVDEEKNTQTSSRYFGLFVSCLGIDLRRLFFGFASIVRVQSVFEKFADLF
jgi:predicted Zn-dependent peptidase